MFECSLRRAACGTALVVFLAGALIACGGGDAEAPGTADKPLAVSASVRTDAAIVNAAPPAVLSDGTLVVVQRRYDGDDDVVDMVHVGRDGRLLLTTELHRLALAEASRCCRIDRVSVKSDDQGGVRIAWLAPLPLGSELRVVRYSATQGLGVSQSLVLADGGSAEHLALSVRPDGGALLCWAEVPANFVSLPDPRRVVGCAEAAGSGAFGTAVQVSESLPFDQSAAMRLAAAYSPAGQRLVLWSQKNADGSADMLRAATAGSGSAWGAPSTVSGDPLGGGATTPGITSIVASVDDAGRALVAWLWQSQDLTSMRIDHNRRGADGAWSQASVLASDADRLDLSTDRAGRLAALAFRDRSAGNGQDRLRVSRFRDTALQGSDVVSAAPPETAGSAVAQLEDGRIMTAWVEDLPSGASALRFNSFVPVTGSWAGIQDIAMAFGGIPQQPALRAGASGSDVTALWTEWDATSSTRPLIAATAR